MLGPADGRHVVREPGAAGDPDWVVVIATLGAPKRRRLRGRRGRALATGEAPRPAAVTVTRATVIETVAATDGELEPERALVALNRVVHAHRIAAADPTVLDASLDRASAVRVGRASGEQAAHGVLADARELPPAPADRGPKRRASALAPQERAAAVAGGRLPSLVCEELALRARADVDAGRAGEAAAQSLAALDAGLVELSRLPALRSRVAELGELRPSLAQAARDALSGDPPEPEVTTHVLGRLEAALRARAASL